jgi:hypothetical protein
MDKGEERSWVEGQNVKKRKRNCKPMICQNSAPGKGPCRCNGGGRSRAPTLKESIPLAAPHAAQNAPQLGTALCIAIVTASSGKVGRHGPLSSKALAIEDSVVWKSRLGRRDFTLLKSREGQFTKEVLGTKLIALILAIP